MKTTTFDLSENVTVDVAYTIENEEMPPRGPEELDSPRTIKVVKLGKVARPFFKHECLNNSYYIELTFDDIAALEAYIDLQMNQDIDKYLADES